MTIQCCQCKRVRAGAEWKDAEPITPGSASYTYCPTCLTASVTQFSIERASQPRVQQRVGRIFQPAMGT